MVEVDKQIKIINMYKGGNSYQQISDELGISRATVGRVLHKNNVEIRTDHRSYTLNESFFEVIDSEIKAYFLGLLYADGFVGDGNWSNIVLVQKEEDLDILYKFKEAIQFTGEIKNEGKGGFENSSVRYGIRFSSVKMANDLRAHGVFRNKSLTMDELPSMGKWLMRHFIRGYFDGDGSIWFSNNTSNHKMADGGSKTYTYKKYGMSWIGTVDFIYKMEDHMVNEDQLSVKFSYAKSKTDELIYLTTTGKKNLLILRDYLYSGATVYLSRKYIKWNEVTCPYDE